MALPPIDLRSSWAVDDEVDQEDARVSMAALIMPGLRDPASSDDQPISRGGLRPGYTVGGGYTTGAAVVPPGTLAFTGATQLTVQPFQLFLPSGRGGGSGAASGGVYVVTCDAPKIIDGLLNTPAHGSLPRIDMLIVQQNDTYYGDPDSTARIRLIPGIPTSSPTKNLTAITGSKDWIELGSWRVPAGTTNLQTAAASMTDAQKAELNPPDRYSVAAGGVLPTNTAGRDLLTPRAWPGLTIYNTDSRVLEVAAGPGGPWTRVLGPAPVLPASTLAPTAQPVQIDGTLYFYDDDLYIFRAPGTMRRLTYTNVSGSKWQMMTLATGVQAYSAYPQARQIGPYTAQMCGDVQRTLDADFGQGALLAALPGTALPGGRSLRPTVYQSLVCVTEYGSSYTTSAKVGVSGTGDGKINYYVPELADRTPGHKAKWVGFDGITYYLDKPPV